MPSRNNKQLTQRERLRRKHNIITAPKPVANSLERLNENPYKGNQNTVVTLTEFGDFGCEACQSWHEAGIIQEILSTFDGQVKFEWKDFPVITSYSPKAAEAGQCALDQGKFWEFHDATFERENYSALSQKDLLAYAEKSNLAVSIFEQCLDSNQHKDTVDFDLQAARALGLRGTPAFLVNGFSLIGANPSAIITAINSELESLQN